MWFWHILFHVAEDSAKGCGSDSGYSPGSGLAWFLSSVIPLRTFYRMNTVIWILGSHTQIIMGEYNVQMNNNLK